MPRRLLPRLHRRMAVATIRSSGRSPPRRQLLLQLPPPLRHLHLPRLRSSHLPPRKAPHRPSSRHHITPLLATAKTNGDKKRTATTTTVPTTKSTRRVTHATDSRANCLALSSPRQQVVALHALIPQLRDRVGHRRILHRRHSRPLLHRLHRRLHRLLLLPRRRLWHLPRRPLPEPQLQPKTVERCSTLSRAVRACARLLRTTGAVLRSLDASSEMLRRQYT